MEKPRNVVILRHAESAGNRAHRLSRGGDHSHFTPQFRRLPQSLWPITEDGQQQVAAARDWLRARQLTNFVVQMRSPYTRTTQTADGLELPGQWIDDPDLRERFTGDMEKESYPDPERQALFAEHIAEFARDPVSWRPPNGESMLDMIERVARPLQRAFELARGGNVILVSHLEAIIPLRFHMERMTPEDFAEAQRRDDRCFKEIGNCRILHYTREDPFTGHLEPDFQWMRSVCAINDSNPGWSRIMRSSRS